MITNSFIPKTNKASNLSNIPLGTDYLIKEVFQ